MLAVSVLPISAPRVLLRRKRGSAGLQKYHIAKKHHHVAQGNIEITEISGQDIPSDGRERRFSPGTSQRQLIDKYGDI
jgi:hypothetical protein